MADRHDDRIRPQDVRNLAIFAMSAARVSGQQMELICAAVLARLNAGDQINAGDQKTGEADRFSEGRPHHLFTITDKCVGDLGMTRSELCEVAMAMSDHTAVNLILDNLGGPDSVTKFMRPLGRRYSTRPPGTRPR